MYNIKRSMQFGKIGFYSFLVFCLILTACTSESEKQARARMANSSPTKSGKRSLPTDVNQNTLGWRGIDGKRETFADFRGKVVILDFWATYCPPCIEGIPHFNELKKRYAAEGLEIVGLHVGGDEDRPKIPEFVEKLQISYKLAYPDDLLTDFYLQGDSRIPQTLIFDRNGQLVEQFVSFNEEIKNGIDRAVEQALKTK